MRVNQYPYIWKWKLKNLKFVNCTFIIYKNGNKTSIQPILKLNSTSFMFNNFFCEMKGKKVIHWGGLRECGNCPNFVLKCNFSIYMHIQVYYLDIKAITTLLSLLLVLYMLVSIHSFFYLTTTLLKSHIFQHSKAYSSHSFQPTGIGLASLWGGNRCVLPIISIYL